MKLLRLVLVLCASWLAMGVASAEPVDINNASAAAIADGLKGIGAARAQAITTYRRKHGPFKNMDDLAQVKGIGEKVLGANKDNIIFGELKTKVSKQK